MKSSHHPAALERADDSISGVEIQGLGRSCGAIVNAAKI